MAAYRHNIKGLVFDEAELELEWCNLDEAIAELDNAGTSYEGSFPTSLDVGLYSRPSVGLSTSPIQGSG